MGVHTACCSIGLLFLGAVSSATLAELSPTELDALRALRDQAASIQEDAAETPRPPWLDIFPDMPAFDQGRAVGKRAGEAARDAVLGRRDGACEDLGGDCSAPEVQPDPMAGREIATIFVSRSLGDGALRQIFATASRRSDTRVLFRGTAEGESLGEFLAATAVLLRDLDPPPPVMIDPGPFREYTIERVPTVVLSGPEGMIARVTGLSSATWLHEQVEAGRTGDLGQRGPTMEIDEPDMIEELRRRVSDIDWAAKKEAAVARWWERARFEPLPEATRHRSRLVDPTIELYQDIRTPKGEVIAREGDRINPLDILPFTLRLVIFDATRTEQIELARRLGQAPGGLRPVYIATQFDRDKGWEGFRAVEDRLNDPVYLLTPDIRDRFSLARVPAVVEAQGTAFSVREVPVP